MLFYFGKKYHETRYRMQVLENKDNLEMRSIYVDKIRTSWIILLDCLHFPEDKFLPGVMYEIV